MFQQKLRRLEVVGQPLADGALNDPAACKADEHFGLGDDDVSQRGKGGGDTAGGGVGENGDVQQSGIAVTGHSSGGLGHLHQGDDALLHPGAAGCRKEHHRQPLFGSPFKGAGDLLTHHRTHGSHHEPGIHNDNHAFPGADGTFSGNDRLGEAGFFLGFSHLFLISLKVQGIEGGEPFVIFHKAVLVHRQLQPLLTGDAGVIGAGRTDLQVGIEIVHEHDVLAAGAFEQQIFGNPGPGIGSFLSGGRPAVIIQSGFDDLE